MSRVSQSACLALVGFLGATFGGLASGQEQPGPPLAKNQIRVVTNEIVIPVTVTDATGEFVRDLEQKDFHVTDDGTERTFDHWGLGGDPLAVALVIDTSSRLHALAPAIHSLGSIFTETVMALDGEAAVITYDSTIDVRQRFTTDHEAIEKAIAQTKFEAQEMNLYDGMAEAVELLKAEPTTRRRIMLIINVSEDTGSKANLRQVVHDAGDANITIYAVGPSSIAADYRGNVTDPPPIKLPKLPPIVAGSCTDPSGHGCEDDLSRPVFWLLERGVSQIRSHQLTVAAAATGGIRYRAFKDSAVRNALDRIGSELHAQYILDYRPNGTRSVGYHTIDVTLSRPGLSVRARPGYYLAPGPDETKAKGRV